MVALTDIHGPDDLRLLDAGELAGLAAQIRTFLIREVSRTGGHLGPNLGVVELTMAVHRVFQSPHDQISSTPATSATCTSCSPAGRTSPP